MSIKEQIEKYGVTPNKALGQNFLINEDAIFSIVSAARAENKNVLEIGAGLGAITRGLNERAKKTLVVEIDKAMVDALYSMPWSHPENLRILHADFLNVSDDVIRDELGDDFCVVANLPYYVTTPICMKLLTCGFDIESMTLMMQTEAAQRFTAKPCSKLYTPLAVLTDSQYTVSSVLSTSPSDYYPQPEVYSKVIRLERKERDLSQVKPLARVLKAAFSMRRKTLQNNIMTLGFDKNKAAELLKRADIACERRAETLTTDEFLRLTRVVAE